MKIRLLTLLALMVVLMSDLTCLVVTDYRSAVQEV